MNPVPHHVLAVAAAFGIALGASADATAVDAAAAQQLARQSNCLKCHAVDRKKEGPSYKDVAAKYKGKANADVAWRAMNFVDGQINNLAIFPDNNDAVAYLFREIECDYN